VRSLVCERRWEGLPKGPVHGDEWELEKRPRSRHGRERGESGAGRVEDPAGGRGRGLTWRAGA